MISEKPSNLESSTFDLYLNLLLFTKHLSTVVYKWDFFFTTFCNTDPVKARV